MGKSNLALITAVAMALAYGIIDSTNEKEAYKILDDKQREDEKRFLETLSGEPRKIWRRRIAKGLSRSELEYVRERLRNE